jgi:hypothetical protein
MYKKIRLKLHVNTEINNTESKAQTMADAMPESSTEKTFSFLKTDIANLNLGKPTTSVAITQGTEKAVTIPINTKDS